MDAAKKREIVNFFINKGILVTEELLGILNDNSKVEQLSTFVESSQSKDTATINSELSTIINPNKKPIQSDGLEGQVEIITNHREDSGKRQVADFVAYFNARYQALEKMLSNRSEMSRLMAISRVVNKKDKGTVAIIGLVNNKETTKNGNLILTLEDNTGQIKVLISKDKPELIEIAADIMLDETIGIVGMSGDKIVFCNDLLLPDIPRGRELKKSERDVYAIFLSDVHVGSNNFVQKDFEKFIAWINGNAGSETQKSIVEKVGYIFIIGDLVDGVGIYPGQEEELDIKDIYEQYEEAAKYLSQIPNRIKIIICPGNHDAMRIAEPQPPLYKDLAAPLYELDNVVMVSNPSIVRIEPHDPCGGFNVLLYHGFSFDFYAANVESIRNNGGYDRADLIMKYLLQRRHLAPAHTSTLYTPSTFKDYLIIEQPPDIFATGHIHKFSVSSYRGITCICGSCWQSKTSFQEKVGHHPEVGRVPMINLRSRAVKVLKFSSEDG